MAEIKIRIHSETLYSQINKRVQDKLEKGGLSDDVKKESARLYAEKVEHYVPRKTGKLRGEPGFESFVDIVPYQGVYAVKYDAYRVNKDGKEAHYAEAQYEGDPTWDRTTYDTYDHWNQHLDAAEREELYYNIAQLVSEGMNNA